MYLRSPRKSPSPGLADQRYRGVPYKLRHRPRLPDFGDNATSTRYGYGVGYSSQDGTDMNYNPNRTGTGQNTNMAYSSNPTSVGNTQGSIGLFQQALMDQQNQLANLDSSQTPKASKQPWLGNAFNPVSQPTFGRLQGPVPGGAGFQHTAPVTMPHPISHNHRYETRSNAGHPMPADKSPIQPAERAWSNARPLPQPCTSGNWNMPRQVTKQFANLSLGVPLKLSRASQPAEAEAPLNLSRPSSTNPQPMLGPRVDAPLNLSRTSSRNPQPMLGPRTEASGANMSNFSGKHVSAGSITVEASNCLSFGTDRGATLQKKQEIELQLGRGQPDANWKYQGTIEPVAGPSSTGIANSPVLMTGKRRLYFPAGGLAPLPILPGTLTSPPGQRKLNLNTPNQISPGIGGPVPPQQSKKQQPGMFNPPLPAAIRASAGKAKKFMPTPGTRTLQPLQPVLARPKLGILGFPLSTFAPIASTVGPKETQKTNRAFGNAYKPSGDNFTPTRISTAPARVAAPKRKNVTTPLFPGSTPVLHAPPVKEQGNFPQTSWGAGVFQGGQDDSRAPKSDVPTANQNNQYKNKDNQKQGSSAEGVPQKSGFPTMDNHNAGEVTVEANNPQAATFKGLVTQVSEGRPVDKLLDKLEANYYKTRSLVYETSMKGKVTTPMMFLRSIYRRMRIPIHVEVFKFLTEEGAYQFRSEVFAGGFCGVGHAVCQGFSQQLAAVHILERMRVHFQALLEPTFYGLIPGCQYTQIDEKLQDLCEKYQLGAIHYWVADLWARKSRNIHNPRFDCACRVKNFEITVHSDDEYLGRNLAAMQMYMHFVPSPMVPEEPLKDYFDIGAGCPKLKRIHPSLLIHQPSTVKNMWKTQYRITDADGVLHDPTNQSDYLYSKFNTSVGGERRIENNGYLLQFGDLLEEALGWYVFYRQKQGVFGRRKQGRREPGTMDVDGAGEDEEANDEEFFDAVE